MLTIKNLSHTYPNGVRALDDISLSVPTGMFGLLGPNGAGKSSLMRSIATLQRPSIGQIRLNTIDVLAEPDRLRRQLGYLPQDFGVYPRGSALQLLDHLAVLKGIAGRQRRQLVEHLLRQTNLYSARHQRVATFSGGMRQRFGIAQALIGQPKLIIVDEPTAGLDPEERNRFLNLLSGIAEDVVVILSTHIVNDVADLCPRMAVLAEGRLLAQGEPRSLIAALRGCIWQRSVDRADLDAFKAKHRVLSNHLASGRCMIRIESSAPPGDGFEPSPPSLADAYFAAIQRARDLPSSKQQSAGDSVLGARS